MTVDNTVSCAIPQPLKISPPGEREVVDKARAIEITSYWKDELLAHRAKIGSAINAPLCDSINLSNKSYTREAAEEVAKFLTSTDTFDPSIASGITFVDASDVIAGRMEEEGLQVLTSLSDAFASSTLTEVDLSDNAMGSKGITACATLLGGAASHSIQSLSLCNNGLSEASMNEIAEILTTKRAQGSGSESTCIASGLTKIHFYNNMSGDGGCKAFAKIIANCSSKIQDIRFSGTRAGADGSDIVVEAMHALATSANEGDASDGYKLDNLVRLDFADNTFGRCGETLSKALEKCSKLSYLNLKDCVMDNNGVRSVCSALTQSGCSLKYLDISGNEIPPEIVSSVAALLEDDTIGDSIRYLAMEECEMTSIGVKRIANALSKGGCTKLEEINLEGNECGRVGAVALANLVKTGGVPNLKCIRLDRNFFPSESVDILEAAFGSKLVEMEDNDDEEDLDEDLDEEEDSSGAVTDKLASMLGKMAV